MWKYLYNPNKINYVRGKKPAVECILCAIRDGSPDVKSLEIWRDDSFIITVNLYPYNPGHIMIFPSRHVEDIRDLTESEAANLHLLTKKSVQILDEEFSPKGFNIGFNMGSGSGESIHHIHQHIVPRYGNEAGFMDVIAGTRLFVSDPADVMSTLKARFNS